MLGIAAIGSTTQDRQIPRHTDSDRHGDILVDCKVTPFTNLVLDFTLTHPQTGSTDKYHIGSWKPDTLDMANNKKIKKCTFPYEQAQHPFLSLTADTYSRISNDFVRFLWMMATSASTNFRLSQPSPNSEPSLSQDTFTKLCCSPFPCFRVQIAAAITKAAAASFVPDSTNVGIPTFACGTWIRPGKQSPPVSYPVHIVFCLFLCVCLCCAFCNLVTCLYLCFLFSVCWFLQSVVLLLYVTLALLFPLHIFCSCIHTYIIYFPFFSTVILSIKTTLFSW